MRCLFMGTPDFAVSILEAMENAGHEILLAVTQPDKPSGRKRLLTPPPVKLWARERGIPVFQPEKIRDAEAVREILKYNPDIGVVAAYGQIIPTKILSAPRYGCINVHASLLPKYRGASPIQWSILNGDKITGITIMQMEAGLDSGDIISQESVYIEKDDTGGSLFDKLAGLGGEACCGAMAQIESGRAKRTPQNEKDATYVTVIKKEFGEIDFNKDAEYIERMVRALQPWPSAYTYFKGSPLKILEAKALNADELLSRIKEADRERLLNFDIGTVAYTDDTQIAVKTKTGYLSITRLQPAGKKPMSAGDFLNGNALLPGTLLDKIQ